MSSTRSHLFTVNKNSIEEDQHNNKREHQRNLHCQGDQIPPVIDMSSHEIGLPPPQSPSNHDFHSPLLDEISSPLNVQVFDFCNPDIFSSSLPNCEATSTSSPHGCGFEDHNSSSYIKNFSFPPDNVLDKNNNTHQDEMDDISASIDFSPTSPFCGGAVSYNINHIINSTQQQVEEYPVVYPTSIEQLHQLKNVFEEEDCLSVSPIMPAFLRLDHSNSFLGQSFLQGNVDGGFGVDAGSLFMGSGLHGKDMEFQGDSNGGMFVPDHLPPVYNSPDKQAYSSESCQMVRAASSSTPLSTEISNLENSSFKVGKLSVEQRKEKIHRYLKKRNERNFSKKIKYACRKTLADSRPRVRGRFAKNDDFVETHNHSTHIINGHHDPEDDYDDVTGVKEEDDMVDSSDIFSHISGVNSFKCNYQIQSWI